MELIELLPGDWRDAMKAYLDPATTGSLEAFVTAEYAAQTVYPPLPDLFNAFRLCPLAEARVLILGQDPYHQDGQAHGLSFSVRPGVPIPPSLRNIFKELRADLHVESPASGDLSGWAKQGVLLLNAVMTVRAGQPGSHARRGWEHLTDAAIMALDDQPSRVVFALWGAYARRKAPLVTAPHHVVLEAGHPSPANVRGFGAARKPNRNHFGGTRPFSAVNAALTEAGREPIRWV